MTEITPEGQGTELGTGQEVPQATEQTAPQQPSINPAWNDLLGVVPSQLHSQVTPHLTKWDQNFQTKINEVHSQYEPWKKYQDNGVSPDDVDYALGLLQALSDNPNEVIKALNEWVGAEQQGQFNQQPQQQAVEPNQIDPNDPILNHPKVQEMNQALQTMAQLLLSQREEAQQDAADEELEEHLNELREKFKEKGDFDEEYVLSVAMNSENFDFNSLSKAVEQYYTMRDNILASKPQRQPGPPVLGAGAAIPSDVPKPQSDKDRRNLVASILAQAHQNT